jgi:hypothetical protein
VVGRNHGKKPLERSGHRWDDNIKTELQEEGWGDIGWIYLAHERDRWWAFVNVAMKFGFHKMLGIS